MAMKSSLTHRSVISKCSLKLYDGGKEIEYNQIHLQLFDSVQLYALLWAQVVLYASIAVFKVWNTLAEQQPEDPRAVDGEHAYSLQMVSTLYMELVEIFVGLLAVYIMKRTVVYRKDWVVHGVILFFNVIVNIYFFIDPMNPLIQVQFIFVVTFSHINRLNSFFWVVWITIFSMICYLNIRISTMQDNPTL